MQLNISFTPFTTTLNGRLAAKLVKFEENRATISNTTSELINFFISLLLSNWLPISYKTFI